MGFERSQLMSAAIRSPAALSLKIIDQAGFFLATVTNRVAHNVLSP
jgi:hypothetical protein